MNIKRITSEMDLHVALAIRRTVFIEEQHVSESDEFDECDTLQEQCQHILVYHENEPSAQAVCASLIRQVSWKESVS